MAAYRNFLLILTGLTGIHSQRVSKVSVEAGDSITVPFLYERQYRNYVKYLCKGRYSWSPCSTAVRTDTPGSSRKFSISDDGIQSLLTVTIKDVTNEDTGYYWSMVELNGPDVGDSFHLSVSGGSARLSVEQQEITGFKGEKITINFYYSHRGEIKWCKLGSFCVNSQTGLIDGTRVTIDASVPSVFTVTMRGLRTESSGWYLCAKGDLQMPVHVTVTERPTTTTPLTTLSPTPSHIPAFGDGAIAIDENKTDGASLDLKSLIISLSLLICIVMVALFIWFMLKRHKRTKAESSPTMAAEEEVTYTHVKHKRNTSGQAEEEATYCNVGYMRKTSGQGEAEDQDVIYSTLALHY